MRHGWQAGGELIHQRNIAGRHGTIVQGYSGLATIIFGSSERRKELSDILTSDEARRGELGYAVFLGLRITDYFTTDDYTLKFWRAQWWADLWD